MDSENGSVPRGLCECGCGQKTRIATRTVLKRGWVAGEPLRFVNHHNRRGAVISPLLDRLMAKVVKVRSGCWEWEGSRNNRNYGMVYRDGKKGVLAHRVSYELFREAIPDGLCVLHRCDNPPCINPEHLFLGTLADNTADMVAKGRSMRGEASPVSRLTVADVRRLRSRAESVRSMAKRLGISEWTLYSAKSGRTWAHVR